jgi:sec-independent protein translocase protein TatB
MFDIGFSELMVIGVVALVVIGPERLPKVARTAGHLMGRLQRYVNDVKADINREMELEELRKFKSEVEQTARSVETQISEEIQKTESTFNSIAQDLDPHALVNSDVTSPAGAAPNAAAVPPGATETGPGLERAA